MASKGFLVSSGAVTMEEVVFSSRWESAYSRFHSLLLSSTQDLANVALMHVSV